MLSELRAAHEALLADTRARLLSLEQSRSSAYSRTLMGTMQLPPPAEIPPETPPAAGGPGAELPTAADGGRAPPYYHQREQGGEGVNAGHGGGAASAPFEIQLPR